MRAFVGLLRASIRRDLGPLIVSGIGIVIGVAALVFFLRIGLGVREHIVTGLLGRLPVGTVELQAQKGTALLGFLTGQQAKGLGPTIAAAKMERLAAHPEVAACGTRTAWTDAAGEVLIPGEIEERNREERRRGLEVD